MELPNEFYRACEEATNTLAAMRAPHVLLKPHFARDGNQYSYLLGDDLAEGVAGFGDTPAKAAQDFDNNWFNDDVSGVKNGKR